MGFYNSLNKISSMGLSGMIWGPTAFIKLGEDSVLFVIGPPKNYGNVYPSHLDFEKSNEDPMGLYSSLSKISSRGYLE